LHSLVGYKDNIKFNSQYKANANTGFYSAREAYPCNVCWNKTLYKMRRKGSQNERAIIQLILNEC